MPEIIMYGYDGCGTCRKAQQWFAEHQLTVRRIAVRDHPPTLAILRRALAASGSIRALFNTSGGAYKEQNIKAILPQLSPEQALALLAKDGHLVKRPLIVYGDRVIVGFQPELYAEHLLPP